MLFRCYGNEKVKTENQIARRGTPFSFCAVFSSLFFEWFPFLPLCSFFILTSTFPILMMFNPLDDILTPRLVLRLMSEEVVDACLSNDLEKAKFLFQSDIPEELLENMSSLIYGKKQLDANPDYLPWSARAILKKGGSEVIGIIRFHSMPGPEYLDHYQANAVEIGYEIFTAQQRQGYATEAMAGVMNWANLNFNIAHFIASVSPDNEASLKLINGFGFLKIDEVMDEEDGLEFVFLRVVPY